jgi:purine-binding chemotaxis protein CheW
VRLQDAAYYLTFTAGEVKHALPIAVVETVELAVEVSPFPDAPHPFIGAINRGGQILPVFGMRRRLHQPERDVRLSDRMVIVRSSRRRLALLVDEVQGVQLLGGSEITSAGALSDGLDCVAGAALSDDGIMLIHDIELFLTDADEKALEKL